MRRSGFLPFRVVAHTIVPEFKPVEEYLKTQNRYDHLFNPVKQRNVINTIQKDIDDYWKRYSDNGQ